MDAAARLRILRIVMPLGLFVAAVGSMASDFHTNPRSLKPFIAVFGANPLGIPTPLASTIAFAVVMLPLVVMLYHLFGLLGVVHEREGRMATGKLAMINAVRRNWSDPRVRGGARAVLIDLAVFALVIGAWIVATERAGV